MEFNFKQLSTPTPMGIKRVRDSILFMISGSLIASPVLAPVFGLTTENYGIWAGVVLILVRGISMMFGVSDEQAMEIAKQTIDKIEKKNVDTQP